MKFARPIGSSARKRQFVSSVAALSLLLLLLLVVKNAARRPDGAPAALANDERSRQSAEAHVRLRDTLNSGRCDQIYDETSAVFRRLESRDKWLEGCEETRRKLGLWTAYGQTSTSTGPGFVTRVDGTAIFERGQAHFSTGWTLEDSSPKLFRLYLEGHIAVPRPNRPTPWHQDLPPPSGS